MIVTFDWITAQAQKLWAGLSSLWTLKLFDLENREVSLSFLIELLISLIIGVLVARAIKGLIKRLLLERLGLERGSIEALSSLIGYVLTSLVLLVVLQSFGIGLSSLTIFAGAIGIGFGIGLQDLASNFISGITILFEQPIKVGDFIEIESLSGTVENISIRATILQTEEGLFAIVPNKKFLESNVINWTYKGRKGRICISIDVPDDSDALVVAEALLAAARRDARILKSPFPEIQFMGFKEGMDFKMLFWVEDVLQKDEISSDVYFMVEEELRMRGIKRSIPQRKLYIQNLSQLTSQLQPSQAEAANDASSSEEVSQALDSQAISKASKTPSLRDLLRQVSYFAGCSELEVRHMILRGYRKTLKADEVICRENDPGDSFYIILSGLVEVFVESIGKRVATRQGGEFVGEMSLLMGMPRTATLRTLEETVLFVVDRENLQSLLEKQPNLADKISEELAKRKDTLEKLGIKMGGAAEEESAFNQIRNRIKSLFGI